MFTTFGSILPALKEYYGEGTAVISFVGSVLTGLSLVSGPLASALVDRLGLRAVFMIGSILCGTSLIASTFSPNAYILILTYGVLGGIGLGLIILPSFDIK